MKYVGIDPGLTGALVVLGVHDVVEFFDTPILEIKSGKKLHRVMDAQGAAELLWRAFDDPYERPVVALEKVNAAPIEGRTQGTTSMFNFGVGFGMWQGILAAMRLPYTLVHPKTWKTKLMTDMGKEKEASILRAKQLYPQAAAQLARKKDHGRADALLLAHYAKTYL